ncbi:hypothetical protein MMSR116_18370 [Methylobacterium mesophilicum SR1.6/6]|uniref:Uncharacterized protein n=1 Tax=Methylobacterium mesophilicum SR1.6/6 TaxID=908290 RepID=A0A6B9FPH5_9HYPH|nr:hypothetical protein [Methylobacterium mesophilicum]QGY03636.1 hypothetical protein MMSR116_18370 [Methylobacterium mesophilicum SR1.6/6]
MRPSVETRKRLFTVTFGERSMTDDTKPHRPLLTGKDLLDRIFDNQDRVAAVTDERWVQLGLQASACYAAVGTVVGYLDRMASCWWGCQGGHHRIEYLCGRATAQTLAALRLMRFGSYDEALLLCRSLGEIANLLFLFRVEPASFAEWMTASEGARRRSFSPVSVRMRLIAGGIDAPIDEHRYRLLSGRAAHVSPDTVPQSHNLLGVPGIGLGWQGIGAVVCLNEIATALALVTVAGSFVLGFDKQLQDEIHDVCRALVTHIGPIDLGHVEKADHELRQNPDARTIFEEVAKAIKAEQAANPRRSSGEGDPQE